MVSYLKVKIGLKIKPVELDKIKKEEIGSTHPAPEKNEESDVEGQAYYEKLVICPHCYSVSWIWYDTLNYYIYTCWYCESDFEI